MPIKFKHLQNIHQSYILHFKNAISYSLQCQKASLFFVIHAVYPDVFVKDGSNEIKKLQDRLRNQGHNTNDKK
jgi:hypothetical protein